MEKSFTNLNLGSGASVLPSHPPLSTGEKVNNIVDAFDRYFGNDLKLENWQRLCRDVGIDSELPSIRKCKQALRPVWVNIHDLMHAVNTDSTPPHRFENERELSAYTKKHKRYYPKEQAKGGGPVRALLAHIFRAH
ncbi:hypothetical protein F5882DRAFT_300108 [Hyaloscypha sp. PMI_1271]|nr:hypothetical protein F5882DRAFT_300108 [Hyaloscypha sp. PMI_1271]